MSNYKLISKISVKTVAGAQTKELARVEAGWKRAELVEVVGIADGTKTGVTDNGSWVAATGQFQAINVSTGEVFRSGVLFLPNAAQNMVNAKLAASKGPVEIGFAIAAIEEPESFTGYVFDCTPLMEMEADDPLARLTKKAGGKLAKAVAKPAPKAEPAPEKTTGKKDTAK